MNLNSDSLVFFEIVLLCIQPVQSQYVLCTEPSLIADYFTDLQYSVDLTFGDFGSLDLTRCLL